MKYDATTLYKRSCLVIGEKALQKTFFSISYMLNSKNRVLNPYFLIETYPVRNALLNIIRGLNQLSIPWRNILFFDGQSFIKTLRGLFLNKIGVSWLFEQI